MTHNISLNHVVIKMANLELCRDRQDLEPRPNHETGRKFDRMNRITGIRFKVFLS